eukprot:scaffold10339_cov41-Cyclotella_meneghiniana.AAC.2
MATGRPPPHCEMQTESQRRSSAPSFINCRQPYSTPNTNVTSPSIMPSPNSASFSLLPRGMAGSSPGFANPTITPVVTAEKVTQSVVDNGAAATRRAAPGFLASSASKILKSGGKGHKRFKNGMGQPSGDMKGGLTPKSPIKKNLIIPTNVYKLPLRHATLTPIRTPRVTRQALP